MRLLSDKDEDRSARLAVSGTAACLGQLLWCVADDLTRGMAGCGGVGDSEGAGEIYIIYNFNAVQCVVLGTAQLGANWHDVKKTLPAIKCIILLIHVWN